MCRTGAPRGPARECVSAASFQVRAGGATLASLAERRTFDPVSPPIPPVSESIDLPHLGKIVYFREGTAWVAVWPDFLDRFSSPIGYGSSPGEAVLELVSQIHEPLDYASVMNVQTAQRKGAG